MTHCLFYHGVEAVTGDLQVRFLKPVPCNAPLHIVANIDSSQSVLYKMKSKLVHDGEVLAWGQATFMKTK